MACGVSAQQLEGDLDGEIQYRFAYHADTKFGTLVPTRQVVRNSREKTSLAKAEKPARSHETFPVVDDAHEGHANSPADPVYHDISFSWFS